MVGSGRAARAGATRMSCPTSSGVRRPPSHAAHPLTRVHARGSCLGAVETYDAGGDAFRGDNGPLHVHRPTPTNPLDLAFLEAGAEAGHPRTDDKNGAQQEGFGVFDRTVHKGERWSTARAYLDPARARPHRLPRCSRLPRHPPLGVSPFCVAFDRRRLECRLLQRG